MPETPRTRSGTTPLHHHPLVLPTLVVLGGWVLLLGGYFPGRPNSSPASADLPADPLGQADTPTPPEALASAPPRVLTVLEVEGRSPSAPIRLTIEFPNGPTDPAVVTVADPGPTAPHAIASKPEPGLKAEHGSAPFDAQLLRTRTAEIEDPVAPPPIPGPPPDFDPTILSPLIPESVPVSPMFERDASAEALIARPMEELPDAFNPGLLLDRYRNDEPWTSDSSSSVSGVEPVAGTLPPATVDRGDLAPEPPAVPEPLSGSSTAPVILPEPSPHPAPALQPADPRGGGPAVPIRQPPAPNRRGLRGLFRAYLPPPPIPLVPPPPRTP